MTKKHSSFYSAVMFVIIIVWAFALVDLVSNLIGLYHGSWKDIVVSSALFGVLSFINLDEEE